MHPVASVTKQHNLVLAREVNRHASQGAGLAASSDVNDKRLGLTAKADEPVVVFIYLFVYEFSTDIHA